MLASNRIYKRNVLNSKICVLYNKKSAGGGSGDCAAARWYHQGLDLGSLRFPESVSVGCRQQLALTVIIQEAGAAPGYMPSHDWLCQQKKKGKLLSMCLSFSQGGKSFPRRAFPWISMPISKEQNDVVQIIDLLSIFVFHLSFSDRGIFT